MRIYEITLEKSIVPKGGSGVDTSTAKGVEKASKPKKPAQPFAGQKSYHNYMQRGPALNRPSMTSKQYGKGNVGLT